MGKYGMPYMGSKSTIAEDVLAVLPKADHFYDLFGGGGAITHCLLSTHPDKYKQVRYNEIKQEITETFLKAVRGEYAYKRFLPSWVSREEFFANKDKDGYIKTCWSFGNRGKTYVFSKEITPYKQSMHSAVVFRYIDTLAEQVLGFSIWPNEYDTIKSRRLYLRQRIEWYRKNGIPQVLIQFLNKKQRQELERTGQISQLRQLEQLQQLRQLEPLERLQQLQQLENIQSVGKLTVSALDYRQVSILPNSVVYCDIPYKGTGDYGQAFDHSAFLDWAAAQTEAVYISEYADLDARFECVARIQKRCLMTQTGESNKLRVEKVFWNKKGVGSA